MNTVFLDNEKDEMLWAFSVSPMVLNPSCNRSKGHRSCSSTASRQFTSGLDVRVCD